jgi:hypothetical protein
MKYKYNEYTELSHLCQWNSPSRIKKFLERDRSEPLDVTNNEGELFKIAAANGFTDVFSTLINHYKKVHGLDEKHIDLDNLSNFYRVKLAEQKLNEVFTDILDMGIPLTDEIKEIIAPYIHELEATDSEYDANSDIDFSNDLNETHDLEDSNNIISQTTETSESNELSSSFENLHLTGCLAVGWE